jgi:peptide/nickel transport system substrate-binding protein
MDEHGLRGLIDRVKAGTMTRRAFVRRVLMLGLSAPMAGMMLDHCGVARAQGASGGAFVYKPTKRGGGGPLKLLWWQGATLLNPHFAVGLKDQEATRPFYEPLAAWDPDGNAFAVLAAEVPSHDNGGLAADGRSVTWTLKRGVTWHDGTPFTADDVVFNWRYAADPATAAVTIGSYKDIIEVEKRDDHTVIVRFAKPTPFWADAFVGARGMIIPKHLFAAYAGDKSRDAPTNLKPVGTGPYKFVEFKPGDMVRGEINPNYHVPNQPHFDTLEMKGGGDAVSAARAVLQTGEYDFGWNLQVEDEILQRLEKGGKGRVLLTEAGAIEHIQLNTTDPWTEVDGERASLKTEHPLFADRAVRRALALLVDRKAVEDHIYGRTGLATGNFLNSPPRLRSTNTRWAFDVDQANRLLEDAGWRRGPDGIRAKDGKKLKLVFQSSINTPRQKTQAIVKQACQKAGIEVELKSVTASVYFSSDVANPDTYAKFYCDMQMYTLNMNQPDAEVFMNVFTSWEAASKANKWQGRNITRWRNPAYDAAFRAAERELDPVKRAALFIRMNDLACGDPVVIPVVHRPRVAAIANGLHCNISGWDNDTGDLRSWYREA